MSVDPIPKNGRYLLIIAYLGFISLGLPDTVIGVAWPSVRESFGLSQGSVSWIFVGAGSGYFISSFYTGRMLGFVGIGALLAISSGLVALSGFGFSFLPIWAAFAACAVVHGLGSGAIDAGLNRYVANHFSARHMNWLHACYTLGAAIGPLIMTAAISWNGAWRLGYLIVASMILSLAVLFAITRRGWDSEKGKQQKEESPSTFREALQHPIVRLQGVIYFVYTGLEITLGQWAFTLLTESRHISQETAGIWVTLYWSSILAGRIFFGAVVDHFGIDRLLRWSTSAAVVGTILFAWNPTSWSSPVGLAISGLGLAAIYPCLMTRTPHRVGARLSGHAIGFQVSVAILGAAALPSLVGFLTGPLGLEVIGVSAIGMAMIVVLLHEILLKKSRLPESRLSDS